MTADDDLQTRLLPGERIVWQGRPAQGALLYGRDAFLIPLGGLFLGFALFWQWNVVSRDAPTFFWIWGIPFLLVGLYVCMGRFFVDARVRASTHYAVTSSRVLILRKGVFKRFTSLAIDRLPELSLDERADGSGTIRFGAPTSMWGQRNGFAYWTPALDASQFLMIADARSVFDRIQRLASGK